MTVTDRRVQAGLVATAGPGEAGSRSPFPRVLRELADADPDRPAITCGELTVTRRNLERQASRLARAYRDLGVGPGDFVTITLPNSVEFYVSVIATWKLGAIPQPLSSRLPEAERAAIIKLARPALIVGVDPAEHPQHASVPRGFEPAADPDGRPLPEAVSPAWKAPTSGGSTGRPKLIVSGSPAMFAPQDAARFHLEPADRQLVPGPLFHTAPFGHSFFGLMRGQHLVVLPRFDAGAALDAIRRHRITFMTVVPTMLLRMLRVIEQFPGRYDLSSLRVLWHLGAPCAPWLKRAWIDLLDADKVWELYGGTEAQAIAIINGTDWLAHPGSVGRPALGEMVILGDDGEVMPAGKVGEIFMRPPPGAAPTFRYIGAEARERDGWTSLGDLGWMDEDRYLYISDRRTDMIVTGGANVYPAEVEAAIESHPQVLSSAVVGLPSPDLGQQVHAVVQATGDLAADDLLDHLRTRLVAYKLPRSVEFVGYSLRDDAGKVRRAAVRDRADARPPLVRE
jgi:bile acid-coenzyme A ligase